MSKKEKPHETKTEYLFVDKNFIKMNNVKPKIDDTLKNSKCNFYSNSDETVNHIINEFSNLGQT